MLFAGSLDGSEKAFSGFMAFHDIVPTEFDGIPVFFPRLFGIAIVKFPGRMGGWFDLFPWAVQRSEERR